MVIRTRSAVRGGPYYPNLTSDAQNKRFGCFFLSHSAKIIRVMWILLSDEKKKKKRGKKGNSPKQHIKASGASTFVDSCRRVPAAPRVRSAKRNGLCSIRT